MFVCSVRWVLLGQLVSLQSPRRYLSLIRICYFRSFLSGRFPILNYTELTGKFDYTMHIRLDADIVAYHGKTEKLETPMSAEQTSQEYSQSKRTVDFGDYTQDTYQQGDTGICLLYTSPSPRD